MHSVLASFYGVCFVSGVKIVASYGTGMVGSLVRGLVFGVVHIDANQIYYKMLKGRLTRKVTNLKRMTNTLGGWYRPIRCTILNQ